jgi:hypothetical protein
LTHINWNVNIISIFTGKAGAWKQLLTPEIARKIEKLLDEIEGSGLTFSDN